jgi:hypothetical protein
MTSRIFLFQLFSAGQKEVWDIQLILNITISPELQVILI